MPRTMAVIGFTFFFSLAFFLETSQTVAFIAMAVAIVGFTVSMIIFSLRRNPLLPTIFLSVLVAGILFFVQTETVYKPAVSLQGKEVSVTGELCELPYINDSGRYCYIVETLSVDDVPYNVKMYFSSEKDIGANPCDIVSLKGEVYVRGGDSEEIRERLMSSEVWLGIRTKDDITVLPGNRNLNFHLLRIRQYTENTILKVFPGKEGSVLLALLLGKTSYMEDSFYKASGNCGILHIFAVSGFNLSLFAMSLYVFLEKKKVSKFISIPICATIVLFIMAVTGFSQSCVRAGIMILTLFIGKLFSQRADSINSLGIAAFLICFMDPFQASSVGFKLSFFASATIIIVSPVIYEKLVSKIDFKFSFVNAVLRYIITTFLSTVCVTVVLFPISIRYFDGVSLVAPLANCFVVFASEFEMILGFIAVTLSSVGFLIPLSKPFFLLAGIISNYIIETASYFGNLKYAFVSTDYPLIDIWFVFVFFAIVCIAPFKISITKKVIYSVSISALSLIFTVSLIAYDINNTVIFTAFSDDSGVVISSDNKRVFIGDVNSYDCMQYLSDLPKGRADAMILTNTKRNTYLTKLLKDFDTNEIVIPEKTYKMLPLSFFITPTVSKNYSLTVSDNLCVNYKYAVDSGAVLINANGKTILMFFKEETDIANFPSEWLNADILYCVNNIPSGIGCEKYSQIIIAADKEKRKETSKSLMPYNDKITYTQGDEVVLKISKDGLCETKIQ